MIEVHELWKPHKSIVFLERVYYLEPDVNAKGYNALVVAMTEMDVEGILHMDHEENGHMLGRCRLKGRFSV